MDLAFRTGEMLWASAQVVNHRTSRAFLASPSPSMRDRREFVLMGQEKVEAAAESVTSMSAYLMAMNVQFATLAFKQSLTAATALMSLAASRTIGQSLGRQAKLIHDTVGNSAVTASRLSGSAAHLAHRGLKPIHSRATKNAKRLGKR
jgi:hypothetical protein